MQSLLCLLLLAACFCSGSGADTPSILFILAGIRTQLSEKGGGADLLISGQTE